MKEPSLRDVFAGIGTAILAAGVMLVAAVVGLVLLLCFVQQGAALVAIGAMFAAGVAGVIALRWMRSRQHPYAHRH